MHGHTRVLLMGALLAALAASADARAGSDRWQGVFATVATPFRPADGSIHEAALEAQIAYVLRQGVDGIVVLDRHGEGPYLQWDERAQVLRAVRRMAFPRLPIIVGIETDNLDVGLQQMAQAKQHGASAVLIRFLGSKPAEAHGLFHCLSEKKLLPIFYDHDRGSLPARTVGHILSLPGVVGMREAQLDMVEALQHVKRCRALGKACFAGTTCDLERFVRAGGAGVMCPEATLLPGQARFLYRACRRGHGHEAWGMCDELAQVSHAVNASTSGSSPVAHAWQRLVPPSTPGEVELPGTLKYGLTCMGVEMAETTRCPAPPVMIVETSRRSVLSRLKSQRAAAVPYSDGQPQNWGVLLRTGGFQLAPGVSHDLLRSQGDGLWGFPIGN